MHRRQTASGLACLQLATTLLQRARLEHPTTGLWEAADLQWWWRTPRASDSLDQLFWLDSEGRPAGAAILTEWRRGWSCEFIVLPSSAGALLPEMWSSAFETIAPLSIETLEVAVDEDDEPSRELARAYGLESNGSVGVACWVRADERPDVTRLPAGYRLADRTQRQAEPHHFIRRSGDVVADRLAQTSLYRSDLDLVVTTSEGEVAGYGLFWLDPVTGVGLVEPMRTEEGHEHRGLARHVLTEGMSRLARLGARRLKVYYEASNVRAERLYLGAGFVPTSTATVFTTATS